MIEIATNLTQSVVTLLCAAWTGWLFYKKRTQVYFTLLCFYVCFGLAGLYWTLYLVLYGTTPEMMLVSYIGWNTSIAFLLLLQFTVSSPEERAFRHPVPWIAPMVGVPIAIWLCFCGSAITQLPSCVMIVLLSWFSLRGFIFSRKQKNRAMIWLHTALLVFAVNEICLWTSATFWISDTMTNPYFWFDFLLSAAMAAILPAVKGVMKA